MLIEASIDANGNLVDFADNIFDNFPEDILKTLEDSYSHIYAHNYDWNSKQDEYIINGEFDGAGFRKWREQNEQDEFIKNLGKIISAVRSDMILFKRRELADKKVKEFESLILPVFGKHITGRALSEFEAAALMWVGYMDDPATQQKKIEQAMQDAKNIIDGEGNIDSTKITPSTMFPGGEVNLPEFERFIEKNPEYQKTFDIWHKLFMEDINLTLQDTKAFRVVDYNMLAPLYKFLMDFRNGGQRISEQMVTALASKAAQDNTRVDHSVRDAQIKKSIGGVPSFTPETFAKKVKESGITYPDVAIAQSLWETGYFSSDIFVDNHNLFGMKHPAKRTTTSIGKQRAHAKYKNWVDSVMDYKLWEDNWELSKLSKDQYIAKLSEIYCMPPDCKKGQYGRNISTLLGKANQLLNLKA